ncbi:MAG: succinyl-diaminopimelate desuccinylase [Woeseiaceae bacterium]|nr:succinyl-diaminopimelate desuccinylase [Woeseiaceae bacterium]
MTTRGLLEALIRRPSITPEDAGCQALLSRELQALGFACEAMPFGDVTNTWARRGRDGPVFCFAGHTDVVPPGPPDAWQSDPFEPTIRDGCLYGRGAADMKASLAAMVVALRNFIERNDSHRGSIAVLLTSDEEGPARNGTRKVMETLNARDERIDWCIVGEPSSSQRLGDVVRIGRRGSLSGKLLVRGTQGHVAYPDKASNPLRLFAPLMNELLFERWDEGNEHFPPTSFEIVSLTSDAGAVNVIPGELRARFNFRYSTEWTHESLAARVQDRFDAAGIDYEIDWHLSGEPFLTSPGALTDAVTAAVREETGYEPVFSTGGGTSDGRFIAPAGVDVVEIGPVNASIHAIDEHVRIDDLDALARIYEKLLERLIG